MVNRLLVERILADIGSNVRGLRDANDIDWKVYTSDIRARRFVERTLHILVEACIDIAQHIITDQGFREPASYRDTFAVLTENGILSPTHSKTFENMASFRNLIVHYYERVDDAIVFGIFKNNLDDFERFSRAVADYLNRKA